MKRKREKTGRKSPKQRKPACFPPLL